MSKMRLSVLSLLIICSTAFGQTAKPTNVAALEKRIAALEVKVAQLEAKLAASGPAAAAPAPAAAGKAAAVGEGGDLIVEFVKIEEGQFGQKSLTFKLTNNTGKAIDSIKGGIQPKDQFGDPFDKIMNGLGVDLDEPLPAGASVLKTGTWIGVSARMIEILQSNPAKVKFDWQTTKIAFVK